MAGEWTIPGERAVSLTLDQLLALTLPEREVNLDGVGSIRVRGLSRQETIAISEATIADDMENRVLAYGMLDPAMTTEQVDEWRCHASSSIIRPALDAILELSGLGPDQQREVESRFRPG